MGRKLLATALQKLQAHFLELDWTYHDFPAGSKNEKMYKWPGDPDEEILICVHKSTGTQELLHRHDYFYFNYTYKGQYESLSYQYDHKIVIRENELFAGQPFAGHALCVHDNQETIIVGVLIQKEVFFRSFLPMLSANSKLFHFFLDPVTQSFADEIIHFKVEQDCNVRTLLEMMVIEYAYKQEDTQNILKPLALSFLMEIARQYAQTHQKTTSEKVSDQIIQYMGEYFDTVTLKKLAKQFHFHPNYVSSLLTRESGKSFSQILLEIRMERACVLLKGTTLPVEKISFMLGYSNTSNFYKAFKKYYKMSPRNYLKSIPPD